jgi:hypothetical protein
LSAADDFPFQDAVSAFATIMDVAVRYTTRTRTDGDVDRLTNAVDDAIVAFERYDPIAAENRPKIHRLVHIPASFERLGNAYDYDGGPYEHATPETRKAAASGNWRTAGANLCNC